MQVLFIIIGKILIIIIPILIGIYFAIKKDYRGIIISLFILILISAPLTVKDIIDNEKTKEKLANIESLMSEDSEDKKQLQEVSLYNEFLLEKQELRDQGFTEEYIKSLLISPISSHYYVEGVNLYSKGQFEKAIENFKEILKNPIIKQGEYQDVLFNTSWFIANCYVYLGYLKEALNYYQELLSISATITEKNKRVYAMAASLVAMGYIKSRLSDKDKEEAIILLTEAYDLLELVDMNFSASDFNLVNPGHPTVVNYRALASRYLGNIFRDQNKLIEGLNRYLDALKLFELEKKIRFHSIITLNLSIGHIYKNLGEPKEAEKYYLNTLQLNQEYEGNSDLLTSETFLLKERRLVSIGSALYNLNKHQEALKKYEEALEIDFKIDRKLGIAYCLRQIGFVYLYSSSLNNIEIAKQKYLQALGYAIHTSDENLIKSIKENLFLIEEGYEINSNS